MYFGIIKEDLFLRIFCDIKILLEYYEERIIISLIGARTFYTLLPFFIYRRFVPFTMKFLLFYLMQFFIYVPSNAKNYGLLKRSLYPRHCNIKKLAFVFLRLFVI